MTQNQPGKDQSLVNEAQILQTGVSSPSHLNTMSPQRSSRNSISSPLKHQQQQQQLEIDQQQQQALLQQQLIIQQNNLLLGELKWPHLRY